MKKHLLTITLAGVFAAGLVAASLAQTTPGAPGAGSGAKPDTPSGNPANAGMTQGPTGGSMAAGGTGGGAGQSTGNGGSGVGKASKDTSEDRVPHD